MKKLVIVGLLAVGCFLAGCGTTRTATTAAGGNWAVTLQGPPANETLFNFVTTFSVDDSGALNVTNLNFLTAGPCFPVTGLGESVGGTFDVTSAASDPIATANVTFTVKGNGNLLTLTFFSSRRRHTRLVSDWSSDVCSSDLHRTANSTTPKKALSVMSSTNYYRSL